MSEIQRIGEVRSTFPRKSDDPLRDAFVLEGSGIGVWDWYVQTGETYFNERWAEIIGYTLDEIQPVSIYTWMKFAHPDDLERSNELLEEHFRGETEYYIFESRMKHKDGHWVWVLDRGKVFEWDDEGNPVRMCGSHFDITDTKRRESALITANRKLSTIFDIIDVGITLTDEDGNIIDCNKASERMLGITKEEHLSRNYAGNEWKIIRKDFTELPTHEYASVRALREGRPVRDEEMGVFRNDQNITWLSVSAAPLGIEGYGVLIAYADITKQVKIQNELEQANRTKDKFFSIIAHDLRSPLTGIQGLVELASLSLSRENHEEVDRYLEIIKESTQHGSELIFNLLQWSRIQSDSIDFSARKIDVSDNIQQSIGLLFSGMKEKNLSIKVEKPEKVYAWADSFMVDTILRNLLSNAVKYSVPGGTIRVIAENQQDQVKISIQDEGVGIPESILQTLFSETKTDSRDGTNGEKGTGLGLILCRDFIRINGGEIHVESQPDTGTTFSFTLPVK